MSEERRLPRREREKQMQRREMLDAALDLFSQKGYGNVSMQEIAEKAEFAIGTLYKFFRSKEDLYRALVLELSDKFDIGAINALASSDDEVEQLRNYLKFKGDVFRANIAMFRVYFFETRGGSNSVLSGLDRELRLRHEQLLRKLAEVLEKGIKRKRFRNVAEPYWLAVAIDGVTFALLHSWLDENEDCPVLDEPDVVLDIFFKGILA